MTRTLSRSRPITGDTALIDRDGQPGGETVEAPKPDTDADAVYATYAEWAAAARPYFLGRAMRPGVFTTFEILLEAPNSIRDPGNRHWAGRLTVECHDEGIFDYACDEHGAERWTKSRRPKTAKSGVRMWVGAAAKAVA